jgi:hypothetical protein
MKSRLITLSVEFQFLAFCCAQYLHNPSIPLEIGWLVAIGFDDSRDVPTMQATRPALWGHSIMSYR